MYRLLLLTPLLMAADWPRFMGPDGSGVSPDSVPAEWSGTKNLRWKVKLPGEGSSSPVVSKGKVFITCYTGEGPKVVRSLVCLERESGKQLWKKDVKAGSAEDPYRGFIRDYGYATNTPACDGERVYAFFGKSGVYCFDYDGKELWKKDVGKQSARTRWGSRSSVMVYKDRVIVPAGDEDRAVFAFDCKTGKQLWKTDGDALEGYYGTPIVYTGGDVDVLLLAVPGELWALNPKNGLRRWYASTEMEGVVSPSVTLAGHAVIINGGFPGTAVQAFKAPGKGVKGDITKKNALWSGIGSFVPTPAYKDGLLYCVTDNGNMVVTDVKTGEQVYSKRLPLGAEGLKVSRPVYASTVIAGGHVIGVTRKSGVFVLATGRDFKQVALNKLGDSSQFNATPAISDGELFLRSDRMAYCISAKAGKEEKE
jgi:outer membrane protein assembly factor BamB